MGKITMFAEPWLLEQEEAPEEWNEYHVLAVYDEYSGRLLELEVLTDEHGVPVPCTVCICGAKDAYDCACGAQWLETKEVSD